MDAESNYELQKLDANCSNCFFMKRDLLTYQQWKSWHRGLAEGQFDREKEKAIADAMAVLPEHGRAGMLRVAQNMKFQFAYTNPIHYGHCKKFDKPVTFLADVCQIETQSCFLHRRDSIPESYPVAVP